jgi:ATP phosphoribosyltransferase
MTSTTRIYASQEAVANEEIKGKLDVLVMLLDSVLKARERVMMDLNVLQSDLDAVVAMLPSMHTPTVSPLSDSTWVAVRAAVPRKQLAEMIPKLKSAGACDIVITTAEQLVP